MSNDVILCIDQGTTNTKAVLLDENGRIVALASAPLAIDHPQSGWVEQSAQDIWSSVLSAIGQCLEKSPASQVQAIGISNQRESVLVWDSGSGEPLGPVITWQCRRTTSATEELKSRGHQERVLALTGLPMDPLFPATKIHWLLKQTGTRNRRAGTVDSWLIWKLTGGEVHATDRSNASRTQLLNIRTGNWDSELCELFDVPAEVLPSVHDSKNLFGHTKGVPGVQDGVPIGSAIGDSHAALFGHAAFNPGEAKATFGTGSSVMMVSSECTVPEHGLTTTIAWSIDNKITYALEGNILVSASLFPWAATMLGLDGDVDRLMQLAETVDDSEGVALVPALVGLGAPHWNPQARGLISGLSFATGPAHIAHAAALSLPLQVVDVFAVMRQQVARQSSRVFVDGGPTRNVFLMKQLAGLMSQPIEISKDPELSALGAGMLAGLQIGFFDSLQHVAELERDRMTIEPAMDPDDRERILSLWDAAVSQCLGAKSLPQEN